MAPPLVVLVPPEQPPALVAAMETSCSSSGRACRAETRTVDAAEPEAELVWMGPEQLVVVVRVRARSRVRERTLRFATADPALERWRAAGLALGVLAAESPEPSSPPAASAEHEPAPAAPPAPTPPASAAPVAPPEPPRVAALATVSLGVAATSGLDASLVWGAEMRVSGDRPLAATVAVGATGKRASEALEEEHLWVSAGAAWQLAQQGPITVRLRGEAGMERLSVALRDGAGRDDRWLPLVRGGADAWVPVRGPVALGLGADVGVRASAPTVYLADDAIARTPRLRLSGGAWVVYAF